jgi:hypothetical protein
MNDKADILICFYIDDFIVYAAVGVAFTDDR